MGGGDSFCERLKNSCQAFEEVCSAFIGVRLQSDEVLCESDAPLTSIIREAPVNRTFPARIREWAWPAHDRRYVLPFQVRVLRNYQILEANDPISISDGQSRGETHLRDHAYEWSIGQLNFFRGEPCRG